MNPEFRRILTAMVIALGAFFVVRLALERFMPPPEKPPGPSTQQPGYVSPTPPPSAPQATPSTRSAPGIASTGPSAPLTVAAGSDTAPLTLGGGENDALRLELHPRGGGLGRMWLYDHSADGEFVYKAEATQNEPYELLRLVGDENQPLLSFLTQRVWISEYDNQYWDLGSQLWEVAEQSNERVVFETALRDADGRDVLRLTKTYALQADKPVLDLTLAVGNAGERPLTIWIDQDGPLGIKKENLQYDMRALLTTQFREGTVHLNKGYKHADLKKAMEAGTPPALVAADQGPFLWTALCNKYFAVYTRPLPRDGTFQEYVSAVTGVLGSLRSTDEDGDLVARLTMKPVTLDPGTTAKYPLEIYAGPKHVDYLVQVNPDYSDSTKLYYQVAQSADSRCCTFCAPAWLRELMVWLLDKIHLIVRNYGVAIIILVIIVRGILHPLAVFQQKSMYKMQEAMGRIQPRMAAIKEKYANDRTRQNQEMMKIWGEEGVNPAGQFVTFLPMMLQMPILIALWTALNTHVALRHSPFCLWITDLSAPDALFTFEPGITIPILGHLPGIGGWFSNIPSFNVLPIMMGVSMWLQQKYMPKPHMQAKLDATKNETSNKPKSGMSPQDQMRQQQMMMYMMSIMFPLMFYYWPSGLNLYWFATNVFGIGESLLIRRQIEREKERRKQLGPPPPKKPGMMSRFFKQMAARAEELQKKADDLSQLEEQRKRQDKQARKAQKRKK